jgi:hypothetical protein
MVSYFPEWPGETGTLQLTMGLDDDKIRLLKQNARQIIKIIDAGNSGVPFEQRFAHIQCPDSTSDIHELACDWRQVLASLQAWDARESMDATEQLSVLFKVCYYNHPHIFIR